MTLTSYYPAPAVRHRIRSKALALLPATLVGLFIYYALPMAMESLVVAIVLLVALVGLTLVVTLGFERLALILLLTASFGSPMDAFKPVSALSFASASDLVLLAGFLVLVPVLLAKPLPDHSLLFLGAVGIVAAGLVSSALSDDPILSLNNLMRLLVGALFVVFVFAWWRPGKNVAIAMAVSFVAGNCFNTLYARIEGTASVEGRYPGLSNHVNVLGFCAMLAIALIPFLLAVIPRRFHWLILAAGAICAYGVWISGSRAALVVAVAVVALYPLLARSVTAALTLFGASLVPLYVVGNILMAGEQSTNPIGRLLGGGSATLSDVARRNEAALALSEFQSSPVFGIGFGKVMAAHNIYLQVASAAGLIGIAFFIVILVAVLRQSFLLRGSWQMLALPAVGYVMVGLMTTLIWDRFIWFVLALPFLLMPGDEETEPEPDPESDSLVQEHA